MVTGQKVRWVLDLMRGTEFAGRTIASYDVVERGRRSTTSCCRRPGRGEPRVRPHRAARRRCSRSARTGTTMRFRARSSRRCAACCSTPAPVAGFGWACFTAVDGDVADGRGRSRPTPRSRNEHLRVAVDSRRRHLHDRDDRRPPARPGSAGSSTAATAATRTTTRRPPIDRVVDAPGRGARDRRSRPVRCGRACSIETDYTWPAYAIGDERSCSARSDETEAVTVAHDARAARRASGSCASRTSSTTGRATTGCARTSRCRRRSPAPTPSARSRSCTAASTAEGGAHEFGLPTFPSRRFVDASDGTPAARSSTTACSSTRSSTTAASSRSRCCGRPASCRAPSRRCGPTRRARPSRCDGAQMLGEQRVRVRGAAPPRRLARRRLLRRRRRVPRPVRTGSRRRPAGAPPAGAGARAARRRRRGLRGASRDGRRARRARVPHRRRAGPVDDRARRRTGTRAGSSTSRGRPVAPVRG